MTSDTIASGGSDHDAVWLRAKLRGSRKPDLVIAQILLPDLVEPPTFYVDRTIVKTDKELAVGEPVDGLVKALLLEVRDDGSLVVQVPGEAVSYGPRLVVPESLAA